MQCRELGCAVEAWNEAGEPVTGEVGELVCTQPIPSMPLYFWNDKDNARYLGSYFDMYPAGHGRLPGGGDGPAAGSAPTHLSGRDEPRRVRYARAEGRQLLYCLPCAGKSGGRAGEWGEGGG